MARLVLPLTLLCCVFRLMPAVADDGVFVRFQLVDPKASPYYVRLAGYIHQSPWYLPRAVIPAGADQQPQQRLEAGQATEWFDVQQHAAGRLHGRLARSGGVAELPHVTADFICDVDDERRTVVIELATAPRADAVVRRWKESFRGSLTGFLVSPRLAEDAATLETATEMTERRLTWARAATGGRRTAPRQLIVQTSFWSPQRPELNLKEAEVLHLLGFNVVGNQRPEVREQFDFRAPGHTHGVKFGPGATREEIDALMKKHAQRYTAPFEPGVPFGFTDEICARPPIGDDQRGLNHFRAWLEQHGVPPRDLGATRLIEVVPIETPEDLRQRARVDGPAARRVFYYTSRFRQQAATERIRWHTKAFHQYFPPGAVTSTLVADHPYFSGTGLGMGMSPNPTWGGYPLACDWFDLARRRAVDLAGIEDWMGLQYMYGPNTTWEGFQLMGFQASIFRSGSGGQLPVIAWITPSDETNLRLKTASALCQGAKHFFYWTYGPTCTSTENYWSDLRGAYDGIAHVTRQLAAAEPIIAPGRMRRARIALLYSISSDLWQPSYVHMLERRGTYLALVHDQFLVDLLTEEDIEAGRLGAYDVLYATDPCLKTAATARIVEWVRRGGHVVGTTAAGTRNEFNEPVTGLSEVFGVAADVPTQIQPGRYHIRGALNAMDYMDEIDLGTVAAGTDFGKLGVIGIKAAIQPTTGEVIGTYRDGSPAVVRNRWGRGTATFNGTCPAIAYLREARFVPAELKEQWPDDLRRFLVDAPRAGHVPRLVELSHPVVEAGVYDSPAGTALVLANFTYQPIAKLEVRLTVPQKPTRVRSVEEGPVPFTAEPRTAKSGAWTVVFTMPLGLTDVVLVEPEAIGNDGESAATHKTGRRD